MPCTVGLLAPLLQSLTCARFPKRGVTAESRELSRQISQPSEACVQLQTQLALREDSELSQFVFGRFLEWLDDGTESHGERYLEMRRRLVTYFDRRNRPAADELADETLNRVARTLDQCGVIVTRPPARYCYTVARFVLLEDLRRTRRHADLDETRLGVDGRVSSADAIEDVTRREQRLDRLDRCLEQLKPEQRSLIIDYYRETGREKIERRREQARRLGISMNALAIRACRIRDTLLTRLEARANGRTKATGPRRHSR
jgi:DNA-directed RNA polymerase specialized sigma24 family protein